MARELGFSTINQMLIYVPVLYHSWGRFFVYSFKIIASRICEPVMSFVPSV